MMYLSLIPELPENILKLAIEREQYRPEKWKRTLQECSPAFKEAIIKLRKLGEKERNRMLETFVSLIRGGGSPRVQGLDYEQSREIIAIACFSDSQLSEIIRCIEPSVLAKNNYLN